MTEPYTYYIKEIVRVIDGDSFVARIDLGFHIQLEKNIRLLGIDAPECRTLDETVKKYGLRAKEKLEEYLTGGDEKIIFVSASVDDKYGRGLGTVYKEGKDVTANEFMLANGYAWYYNGGKRVGEDLHMLSEL